MADLSALNAAVDALVNEENSVRAALDDLAAKVAAGDGITQADVDAITSKLVGVTDDMKTSVARDNVPQDNPAPVDNGGAAPVDNGGVVDNNPAPADNGNVAPADGAPAPVDSNAPVGGDAMPADGGEVFPAADNQGTASN